MGVYAAIDLSNETTNPIAKFGTIGSLMNILIPTLIIGAAFLLLVMLLYGAYSIITSGGNAENMAKAQKTFTFAILGLVVVVLSFLFVKLISLIFKIQAPI